MGVAGQLNQPDNRQQRHHIPQPANHNTGRAPGQAKRNDGDSQQQQRGARHGPNRKGCRKGIIHRQLSGPEYLPDISGIGQGDVGQAVRHWTLCHRRQRALAVGGVKVDQAGQNRHRQKGHLLPNQLRPRPAPPWDYASRPSPRLLASAFCISPKRPVIQQQQHERQGHDCRLGHQPQGEQHQRQDR